jgi:uncharacterized protein
LSPPRHTTGDQAIDPLEARYTRLADILRNLRSVVVAFSAGADSTLVLKVAADVLGPGHLLAVTADSPSVPRAELRDAQRLAAEVGVEHLIIQTTEFQRPEYLANPTNRCYFCKDTLYDHLERVRSVRGFSAIVNGANADDSKDWRPGLQAAGEHAVRAPLAEAGLTKNDVRTLSQRLGLATWDKPASPCLSSRIPYGEEVTPEKLHAIESAEEFLRGLGIRECRVRHHGELARIEVPAAWIPRLADRALAAEIVRRFQELGYAYVTLDLEGFRSGSLNEVIPLRIAGS